MDDYATELASGLPRDTHYQPHTLSGPLPTPATDAPEDAASRDCAAIAQPATGLDPVVASLLPANPDEANLAAQYVAAGAQALDCLRLARERPSDVPRILKCTAQVRAALIRRLGHVPHKLNCGPLPPDLVHAIVTGTSPVLRALDKAPDRATAMAA